MADLQALDLELRRLVYDKLMAGGTIPLISTLVSATGASQGNIRDALSRLSDAHMLVLQRNGEILMANPFSAVPTPFLVSVGQQPLGMAIASGMQWASRRCSIATPSLKHHAAVAAPP